MVGKIASVIVLLLVMAACADTPVGDAVREGVEDIASEVGLAGPTGGPDAPPGEGTGDEGPAEAGGDGSGGAPAEQAPAAVAVDDLGGIGAMCRPYLRPDIPRLVVEVDHQAGAAPAAGAVDHLVGVLRSVVDKPGGVVLAGGGEIAGGAQTWTTDSLRATAQVNREHYSSSEQAVLYVLSVRGEFTERDSIGIAYRASEFALFPDRMGGLTALLGGATALQRSVLVHEVGHLLCLVNLTYTSEIDHEDPERPGHSNSRESVMFWAIENSAVAQLFSGPPPDDFDDADRADLEGLSTGRY